MEKNFLSIDEIKKTQIDILKVIDKFCKENGIKYFINYGTLLGAVRHKGYIPWDDDIDLMMSSYDYEKFIKTFKHEDLTVFTHENNKEYFNNFIKVVDTKTRIIDNRNYKTYECGINVDIFPYYEFDDLKVVNKTYILESFKLLSFSKRKNIIYKDSKIKDFIRTFFWIVLHFVSPRKLAFKIDKIIKKYIKKDGRYVGVLASKLKENEIFENGIFDELIELDFENLKLPAPKNFDKILTQFYGNYMQLPPIEKQVLPHETDVYRI